MIEMVDNWNVINFIAVNHVVCYYRFMACLIFTARCYRGCGIHGQNDINTNRYISLVISYESLYFPYLVNSLIRVYVSEVS